jgi:hypothetical protein
VPSLTPLIGLGLGDLFLTGLLSIQTTKKYGRRFAMLSVVSIATVFGIVEAFMLTYFSHQALPATVMIFGGWVLAVTLGQRHQIARDPLLTEMTGYAAVAIMSLIGILVQSILWLFPAVVMTALAIETALRYRSRRVRL